MYRDRYAMRGNPADHPNDGPTVFATHSTHKLLAALSQTSFIHIRDGRGAIDHGRFNEAYCSQASTSPLYALIASNDVAAAMMDGPGGAGTDPGRHRRSRGLPARRGARSSGVPGQEGLVLRALERREGHRPEDRRSASRSTRPPRSCWPPTRTAGSCTLARSWHGFDRHPRRLVHARPDQVRHRLPGHEDGRRAGRQRHPGGHRHRLPRAAAGSCPRARPTTWCSSSSRWASPRGSGAR